MMEAIYKEWDLEIEIFCESYIYKVVKKEYIKNYKNSKIKVIQWKGNNLKEVLQFAEDSYLDAYSVLRIKDLNGLIHRVEVGDYIIKRKYPWA